MNDPAQPQSGWATPCKVIGVTDGDTIDVEIRRVVRVRLLSCWSAETRTRDVEEKRRGLAAAKHLQELALSKDAVLFIPAGSGHIDDVFTFGRALGYVYVDGKSLSQLQREAGHATETKQ